MLKSKMSDCVLMVDAPGYLAQRFDLRRELKGIISCPPGAPRRPPELPAIAEYLIPLARDWFEVWDYPDCVGSANLATHSPWRSTRRAVEHVLIPSNVI
jgi:hypothetical protein